MSTKKNEVRKDIKRNIQFFEKSIKQITKLL